MNSDEPQFYASATGNQLCSQDPVIATSVLITVLAWPFMVKISLSGVNKRFIISSVWWENGYVRRGEVF